MNKKTYFAAANSYKGFISYFEQVFQSENFDRIFVIKGGPGTGKSSLMRAISDKLDNDGCSVEDILCSSDPNSLDGVIAEKSGRRIALIDGTAPHERDAVIPGAVDEIVNLAKALDERWIIGNKARIISLANEKKNAYKTAYYYLNMAGACDEIMRNHKSAFFDNFKARSKAESVLGSYLTPGAGYMSTRLLSSFGRQGNYKIKPQEGLFARVITIGGDNSLFINLCAELLKENGVNFTVFPTAKDPKSLDGILLNESNTLIISGEEGEINADDFYEISSLENERFKTAAEIYNELLIESTRWFKIASEIHFELEKIYSSAMDFSQNEKVLSDITTKIDSIFEKN